MVRPTAPDTERCTAPFAGHRGLPHYTASVGQIEADPYAIAALAVEVPKFRLRKILP